MIINNIYYYYYALIKKIHIVKVGLKYIFLNVSDFESLFFVVHNI
jgi:hypothetical protein